MNILVSVRAVGLGIALALAANQNATTQMNAFSVGGSYGATISAASSFSGICQYTITAKFGPGRFFPEKRYVTVHDSVKIRQLGSKDELESEKWHITSVNDSLHTIYRFTVSPLLGYTVYTGLPLPGEISSDRMQLSGLVGGLVGSYDLTKYSTASEYLRQNTIRYRFVVGFFLATLSPGKQAIAMRLVDNATSADSRNTELEYSNVTALSAQAGIAFSFTRKFSLFATCLLTHLQASSIKYSTSSAVYKETYRKEHDQTSIRFINWNPMLHIGATFSI